MPPRLNITSFARSIPLRPRPQVQWPARSAIRCSPSQCRPYSDGKTSGANDRSKTTDAQPADHVSEEAAKTAEIMGEQGPDLSKGTPVEEIVKGDKEAQNKLPKVMKDKLKAQGNAAPKGSRSYSTMTTQTGGSNGLDMGLVDVQSAPKLPQTPGLKFEMPSLPLPQDGHVKHRYDPVVEQVTNLLMRHEYGTHSPAPANIADSHHQSSKASPSGRASAVAPTS